MKLSVGLGSPRWTAVAAVVVLVLVMSITAAPSKTARASTPTGFPAMTSAVAEITPGLARAETDTLDLQLD